MPGAHKHAYVHTDVWYEMAEPFLPHMGVQWWGAGLPSSCAGAGSRGATMLGEVERVLHLCSHPKLHLESLVVIAASWGLKVGFQILGIEGNGTAYV